MSTEPPARPAVASPLDRVRIVLVEPLYSGNVGGVARAMKNCGLTQLFVVSPPAFDAERARWMGPGAHDVLANATFVSSLDDALDGVTFAVAATARHRRQRQRVLPPRALGVHVAEGAADAVTAVLFGREDHGLPVTAANRCAAVVRIPTAAHASLNLSQAVLIVAHELFQACRGHGARDTGRQIGGSHVQRSTRELQRRDARDRAAALDAIEPGVDAWVSLLTRVGYTRGASPEKVRTTMTGLLQRAEASRREIDALRGVVNRLNWALDHPELDPTAPRRRH